MLQSIIGLGIPTVATGIYATSQTIRNAPSPVVRLTVRRFVLADVRGPPTALRRRCCGRVPVFDPARLRPPHAPQLHCFCQCTFKLSCGLSVRSHSGAFLSCTQPNQATEFLFYSISVTQTDKTVLNFVRPLYHPTHPISTNGTTNVVCAVGGGNVLVKHTKRVVRCRSLASGPAQLRSLNAWDRHCCAADHTDRFQSPSEPHQHAICQCNRNTKRAVQERDAVTDAHATADAHAR